MSSVVSEGVTRAPDSEPSSGGSGYIEAIQSGQSLVAIANIGTWQNESLELLEYMLSHLGARPDKVLWYQVTKAVPVTSLVEYVVACAWKDGAIVMCDGSRADLGMTAMGY